MKKFVLPLALALIVVGACGRGKKSDKDFPDNFKNIGDAGRIDYMMQRVTPDSLARFIIYGTLGRNPEAPIDTLAIATNYAYEHLKGDDLDKFAEAYNQLTESLPLGEKMVLYREGGTEDPQGLGYRLGLEYLSSIRDGGKSADDVEKELKEFKKACGTDTAMYRRFIIGFKTVLEVDHGKDVSEEIYQRFSKY